MASESGRLHSDVLAWLEAQTWPDVRTQIAASSDNCFEHPNGFLVVRILGSLFPGWTLRAHLWPEHQRQHALATGRHIHLHGFHLYSRTLIGQVHHESLAVGPLTNGQELCEYVVRSDLNAGQSQLSRVRCGLEAHSKHLTRSTSASGLTFVPADEFHSTLSVNGYKWSATVVATEEVIGYQSLVLGETSLPRFILTDRRAVSDLEAPLSFLDSRYREMEGDNDRWIACVFLVKGREVLLVRTHRHPQFWQPAGGRFQAGDFTPAATAIREATEEVGPLPYTDQSLVEVGSAPRDSGEGVVYGYQLRVPSGWQSNPLEREIAEAQWFDVDEIENLSCMAATKVLARSLQICD